MAGALRWLGSWLVVAALAVAAASARGLDEDSVDKAFLGFDQKVLAFLIPGNRDELVSILDVIFDSEGNVDIKGYLHQHLEKFLQLAQGSGSVHTADLVRTKEALDTANSEYPPRGFDPSTGLCPIVDAKLIGDPSSTTKRVYLTLTEHFSVPRGTIVAWYYFFP
jgi:hypothetical protein